MVGSRPGYAASWPIHTDISTRAGCDTSEAIPIELDPRRGQRVERGDSRREARRQTSHRQIERQRLPVLADDTVSRHHCEIIRTARGLLVRDLGSTNQTRIGRSRVTDATLEPGATLTVGDVGPAGP